MNNRSSCPICKSNANRQFHVKNLRELLIFRDCRHIFWAEFPTQDQLIQFYAEHYGNTRGQADNQKKYIDYFRRHLKTLLDFCGSEAKQVSLVDFGCSFPYLLIEAKRMGFQYVAGVDWDQNARCLGEQEGIVMFSPDEFDFGVVGQGIDPAFPI